MARTSETTKLLGPAARQEALQRSAVRVLACIVAITVAFVAGFMLRGNTALMTQLGFVSTSGEESLTTTSTIGTDVNTSASARVAEVENILVNNSLDTFDLDQTSEALIGQFVSSTEDPYLKYFTAERYAEYVKEISSDTTAGIGVLFAEYEGQIYAAEVFEGSTAQIAGVEQGDFVKAIDGESADGLTITEVVNLLTRHEGDSALVTWRRPVSLESPGGEEFVTSLVCEEYESTNVEVDLDSTVGYITISQLTQNASDLMSAAIQELEAQGAESFVLDLRDCPGGFLTQAVDIANLFVKSGTIVQIKTKTATTSKTASGQTVTDKPLVVLVNENTAAAAEVLAAGLQDADRATLVGVNTMGKGSVQVVTELSFGGALRYTAAEYLSPSGHEIDGMGVSPDWIIEDSDGQKDTAMNIAQSLS